ncbi:MAG TPA: NifU family protein [Bacteroidia bacterium]|nr:NifU family protein [Bacteroidia bacterium]
MESTTEKKAIIIYAESTPNPASIKFVANISINPAPAIVFTDAKVAKSSPLASALFEFPFVQSVFLASNFITITKSENVEWAEIMSPVRDFIKSYLESGATVFSKEAPPVVHTDGRANVNAEANVKPFNEIETKIAAVLEEYIKPAVESDGGAISLKSFNEGVVTVIMQGSCSGCPSSTMTLKAGIEGLLKRLIPEVTTVIAEQA